MILNKNAWHFSVYKFFKTQMNRWDDYYPEDPNTIENIGLCPYMRTLLLWGPLQMSFYALCYGAVYIALISIPLYGGFINLFFSLLIVGFCMAIFALMAFIASVDIKELVSSKSAKNNVAIQYAVSLKTKICPIMKVQ